MIIDTKRLILRQFRIEDAKDMFELWGQDEEVSKYTYWNKQESIDETIALIESWVEDKEESFKYHWAIELKENKRVIGHIQLFDINKKLKSCETGFGLSRDYRGCGFATEALKAILDFGMNKMKLVRIYASHAPNNIASVKVLKKSGMQFEGIRRKAYLLKTGQYIDSYSYSLIESDYNSVD